MDRTSKGTDSSGLGLLPGSRVAISLLLFIHLFCVAVAMLSNEVPSMLEDALRRRVPALRAYVQFLMMDFSYSFVYTGSPSDAPTGDSVCWVDIELTLPPNLQKSPQVVIPPDGIKSRLRLRRYERLAYRAVDWVLGGNPAWESTFPGVIARQAVAESGATGGTIHVRWRQLGMDPFVTTGRQTRTVYEAHILVDPDDPSKVELFKIEKASDVVPSADGSPPAETPAKVDTP